MMRRYKLWYLSTLYLLATVQFVWCYLWLVRPYVSTILYERGEERMPFQGRLLMVPLMRWAHTQQWAIWIAGAMHSNRYWFPRPMEPEVIVQAIVNIACVIVAGVVATSIYRGASRWRLMTPLVYPLVLALCVGTYILHTIQNFRFIYDLPSLAFFSVALYLIYFRKPSWLFVLVFIVATLNRETTLLLLPIYALSAAVEEGGICWTRLWSPKILAVILPLAAYWIAVQLEVRHIFAQNASEFYPRIGQNAGFLVSPRAWPQLFGACCYLFPVILVSKSYLKDVQLKAWLWILLAWFGFMFVYGILIETRVFGELIPYVACSSILILEESLVAHMRRRLAGSHTRLLEISGHADASTQSAA